jgi:hypothetical protein
MISGRLWIANPQTNWCVTVEPRAGSEPWDCSSRRDDWSVTWVQKNGAADYADVR